VNALDKVDLSGYKLTPEFPYPKLERTAELDVSNTTVAKRLGECLKNETPVYLAVGLSQNPSNPEECGDVTAEKFPNVFSVSLEKYTSVKTHNHFCVDLEDKESLSTYIPFSTISCIVIGKGTSQYMDKPALLNLFALLSPVGHLYFPFPTEQPAVQVELENTQITEAARNDLAQQISNQPLLKHLNDAGRLDIGNLGKICFPQYSRYYPDMLYFWYL
jgi:hypothetical protein